MMGISVIIPVYNAEKYIERCIASAIKYVNNVEIIAVNDGSTDSSLAILQNLQEQYGTIVKIVNQENAGVSSARNSGIKNASKPYITFLDADDYFVDYLSVPLNGDCDIYVFNYIDVDMKGNCLAKHDLTGKIGKVDDLKEQYVLSYDYNPCWGKLYKRELVLDVSFPIDMKIGEDVVWFGNVLKKIKNVGIFDKYAYAYLQNDSGAMNSLGMKLTDKRIFEFERELLLKGHFLESEEWPEKVETQFITLFANNIVAKINFAIKGSTEKEQLETEESNFIENEVIHAFLKKVLKRKGVPIKRKMVCGLLMSSIGRKIYNQLH